MVQYVHQKWYSMYYPKVVVYNGQIIIFNKSKAVKLDLSSYKFSDFIFRNINLSTIESMNDKYNIAVNKYTSSVTGGEAYMYGAYAGDAGELWRRRRSWWRRRRSWWVTNYLSTLNQIKHSHT